MKILEDRKLDYNDVSIVPNVISYIKSRTDIDISSSLCGISLKIPIVGAPMPDVCNSTMCNCLSKNGAIGIIHRFQTIEEQKNEFANCLHPTICAIGVTGDYQERFRELYEVGCEYFCLDTANGANIQVAKAIQRIREDPIRKNIKLIVGNIGSPETFKWLANQDVNAIRCSIGSGSACSTKNGTGIFYPNISLLMECAEIKYKNSFKVDIIADGGIKSGSELCKAVAAGANVAMVGRALAVCKESPAKTIKIDGRLYKIYRGAASFSVKKEEGSQDNPNRIEGFERLLDYEGPVQKVIENFADGLVSSLSYLNALNLEQYRNSVIFARK